MFVTLKWLSNFPLKITDPSFYVGEELLTKFIIYLHCVINFKQSPVIFRLNIKVLHVFEHWIHGAFCQTLCTAYTHSLYNLRTATNESLERFQKLNCTLAFHHVTSMFCLFCPNIASSISKGVTTNGTCEEVNLRMHPDDSKPHRTTPRVPEKRFECSECHQRFAYPYLLREHQRNQHEHQTYSCDLCPRSYTYFTNLQRHQIRRHSKMKTRASVEVVKRSNDLGNPCEYCQKKFKKKKKFKCWTYLQKHIKAVHFPSGQTWFCEECAVLFVDRGDYFRHIKRVHENKKYPCNHCEKVYHFCSGLKRHIKRAHQEKDSKTSSKPTASVDSEAGSDQI